MSAGWLDGPFDGTSTISAKVNSAVSSGIVWVNSAGNYAQRHWEGEFNDTDGNGKHNFIASDENMSISGGNIVMVLSWDDWPVSDQDYDLYLFNSAGDVIASSRNLQNCTQMPTESISINNLAPGTYNLQIWKDIANRDVTFELYSVYQVLEIQYQVPSRSLSVPADAQGAITVSATYWSNDSLEPFSSRGPTTDGRTKPDVVAPDGVQRSTPSPFSGTSASAPHVAGAAALLLQVNKSMSVNQLKQALESEANDLFEPGKDNKSGWGRIDVYSAYQQIASLLWSPTPSDQVIELSDSFSYDVNTSEYVIITYSVSDIANFSINPATGLITNKTSLNAGNYDLTITATDASRNTNSSTIIVTVTASAEDTTAPASITDLMNMSYAQNHINWTWIYPSDPDFSKVIIYIDDEFMAEVPKDIQYYNATNLG